MFVGTLLLKMITNNNINYLKNEISSTSEKDLIHFLLDDFINIFQLDTFKYKHNTIKILVLIMKMGGKIERTKWTGELTCRFIIVINDITLDNVSVIF